MLELYQRISCPYCAKVRQTLDDLGVDYICRTAPKGSKQREIMVKLGGKEQVPFLVDQAKGVMMYESEEIIKYLEENNKEPLLKS